MKSFLVIYLLFISGVVQSTILKKAVDGVSYTFIEKEESIRVKTVDVDLSIKKTKCNKDIYEDFKKELTLNFKKKKTSKKDLFFFSSLAAETLKLKYQDKFLCGEKL